MVGGGSSFDGAFSNFQRIACIGSVDFVLLYSALAFERRSLVDEQQ